MGAQLFVSRSAVVDRTQINEALDGAAAVIDSALSGAHIFVESLLGTKLTLNHHLSIYELDSDAFSGMQPGGVFRLQLPGYFVKNTQSHPLVVKSGDSYFGPKTTVPPLAYSLDAEKGVLSINALEYNDSFIEVDCYAGLDPDAVLVPADIPNGIEEERGPEAPPPWLEEAILSYVGVLLSTNPDKGGGPLATKAAKAATDIILPNLRKRGFMLRPL